MDGLTLAAVLFGAFCHASWNALVKIGLDRFLTVVLLSVAQGAIGLALLPFFEPLAGVEWLIAFGSALLHTGYKLFLSRAYAAGDLSQIYPLARGAAPLIVAFAGLAFFADPLRAATLAGILALAAGVALMSLRGGALGLTRPAVLYALGTSGFIAAYTLYDGWAVRGIGKVSAYTMSEFALDGLCMLAVASARRGRALLATPARTWGLGLVAGALSLVAYWITLWAFTRAPVAAVAALRETSVFFALLIAIALLGERLTRPRLLASALILAGVALLRL